MVSSSAVCVESSLLVIFISFAVVFQNASENISSLREGSDKLPKEDILSNQNLAFLIQLFPS